RVVHAGSLPLEVFGLGSNVLVPDEGLPGVVCRLEGEFTEFEIDGEEVTAGAGVRLPKLARVTIASGLLGLEALSGFPSTVGGAVAMNAGCYGTEVKDVLLSAQCLTGRGEPVSVSLDEMRPRYRKTNLSRKGYVVTSARFRLRRGDADVAAARIKELNRKRWKALPTGRPIAGSIFKNPPGDFAGRLVDECGLRGHRIGGAAISIEHANVITNEEGARASEVLDLMLLARRQVLERFDVELFPELVLLGSLGEHWRRSIAG
ncbi:MAG: UDP-N-acetylmuramate dehydrogenase, partial [Acidobacteriota bacterium]